MFECIMFLKANQAYWGIAEGAEAMRRAVGDNSTEREERDYHDHVMNQEKN